MMGPAHSGQTRMYWVSARYASARYRRGRSEEDDGSGGGQGGTMDATLFGKYSVLGNRI
jgi:hypothetical protein